MKNNKWKYEAAVLLRQFGFNNKSILAFIRKSENNHQGSKPDVLYNATLKLAFANL